jgi:hypothetical protein
MAYANHVVRVTLYSAHHDQHEVRDTDGVLLHNCKVQRTASQRPRLYSGLRRELGESVTMPGRDHGRQVNPRRFPVAINGTLHITRPERTLG